MTRQRVFITGGAAGLGQALAHRFASAGADVCIGDIDDAAGEAVCAALSALGVRAHFLHCNVTRDGDLEAAASWLQSNWGGVDILVNNAGVAQMGPVVETTLADWQWITDINLLGVVRGCRAFVPMMQAQRSGTILNIASMAGLIHLPGATAYNTTKAAVVALSETLELELEAHGIRVSVACPSFFRSDLAKNMRSADAQSETITKRLVERARLSADDIAKAIVDGLGKGQTHILPHPGTQTAWRMKRYLPHGLWLRSLRRQVAKLNARFQRKGTTS